MLFSKTLVTFALLAAPAFAAPLASNSVTDKVCLDGTYKHPETGVCTPLNGCIFVKTNGVVTLVGNLLGWKVDASKALDPDLNSCLTVESCKSDLIKEVIQTTVAGWTKINVCAVKTCTTGNILVGYPFIDIIDFRLTRLLQDITTGTCVAVSRCEKTVGGLCQLVNSVVKTVEKVIQGLDTTISATLSALAGTVIALDASLRATLLATVDLAVSACADLKAHLHGHASILAVDASIFASVDSCMSAVATLRAALVASASIDSALALTLHNAHLASAELMQKLALELSAHGTIASIVADLSKSLHIIEAKLSSTLSTVVRGALSTSVRAIADVKVLLSKLTITLDATIRATLDKTVVAIADLEVLVAGLKGAAQADVQAKLAAALRLVAELKARVEADVVLAANVQLTSTIAGCLTALAQIQAAIDLGIDLDVSAVPSLTVA